MYHRAYDTSGSLSELPLINILIEQGVIMFDIKRTLELRKFIYTINPANPYYNVVTGAKPYINAILLNDFSVYDEVCCTYKYNLLDRIHKYVYRYRR